MIIQKYKAKYKGYYYICKCDYCDAILKRAAYKVEKHKFHYCNRICQKKHQATFCREQTSRWLGGRICSHSNGYIRIYTPEHPHSDSIGYVYEHRLVMEKHLGRYLTKDEIVHHIDRDVINNNLSNLFLTNKAKHSKIEDKYKTRNALGQYMCK